MTTPRSIVMAVPSTSAESPQRSAGVSVALQLDMCTRTHGDACRLEVLLHTLTHVHCNASPSRPPAHPPLRVTTRTCARLSHVGLGVFQSVQLTFNSAMTLLIVVYFSTFLLQVCATLTRRAWPAFNVRIHARTPKSPSRAK